MNIFSMGVFAILGLIWGSNFIYMKMASEFLDPNQVVFYRVLAGFTVVFLYALYRKSIRLADLKYSHHFFVMSIFASVLYFNLYVIGSSLLLSGIAGALSGSIPIFSFLITAIFLKEEKISKGAILGVVLGFLGVLLISDVFNANLSNVDSKGVLAIIFGSLSVGASFVYARKFVTPLKIKAVALTTYQLAFALLLVLFLTDFNGIDNIWNDTHSALGLIVGLGFLGTGVTYIGYYFIIEKLGALKASSITYIPPIVALFIGFFIVGEDIKIMDLFAMVLIFLGVFLINKK